MLENHEQTARRERAARRRPLFGEFSRGRQVLSVIAAPVVFGVLAGLALGWSAAAWWALQALGILGAVATGLEHRRRRSAALRGAVAGLLAAATIVGVHAVTSAEATVAFDPVSFPVIATVASAGLHAVINRH